jgi:hypothetical protein
VSTKPKLADVQWLTATMLPVTTCQPPDDAEVCWLRRGHHCTPAEAKRHAADNPGHVVTRR